MHPENEDVPQAEKAVPCEVCRADSECAIWGHRVCYGCASDWRDRAPTYEAIEAKHGPTADTGIVYREFTERWLAKRKARAA